jgi:long-chain acyl-CoA synthetase
MTTANLASVLGRESRPTDPALVDLSGLEPVSYTYGQLEAQAAGVAAALRMRGHRPGSRIGMLCGNSAAFYGAYFGALRAGCTIVPYNARAGAEAIAHVCRDAALELLIADGAPPEGVPQDLEVVRVDSAAFRTWLDTPGDGDLAPPGDAPAVILYTSGSTGRPKGVMLSHSSQIAIVDGLLHPVVRGFLERGPCIVAAPLFHMNGLIFSEMAFAGRGRVVLMRRFDAGEFIEAVSSYGVTILSGVPTMIALVAQQREALAKADLSRVELVFIGSAPLSDTVLAQAREIFPRAAVMNSYGTTEIGAGIFGPHPQGLPRPPLSIGHPAAHAEVRLVDGGSADEGVLEVRSPASMTGYVNLPEVTARKMRDGWINTGDIMRLDANGFLYFVGRSDDMFSCSGENIYPGEVERILERHADVLEVSVVPLSDPVRGHVPVAFIVPRRGASLSEREIKDFVLANAAPHLHPRRVWFLDRMPLSGVNKIDRHALKARAEQLSAEPAR